MFCVNDCTPSTARLAEDDNREIVPCIAFRLPPPLVQLDALAALYLEVDAGNVVPKIAELASISLALESALAQQIAKLAFSIGTLAPTLPPAAH